MKSTHERVLRFLGAAVFAFGVIHCGGVSGTADARPRVQDHRSQQTGTSSSRPQIQDHRSGKPEPRKYIGCYGYQGRCGPPTPPPVVPRRNNCPGGVC